MQNQNDKTPSSLLGSRLSVLCVVAIIIAVAYTWFGDTLSLESLARQETQLRNYQQSQPVIVFGAASVSYTHLTLPTICSV